MYRDRLYIRVYMAVYPLFPRDFAAIQGILRDFVRISAISMRKSELLRIDVTIRAACVL